MAAEGDGENAGWWGAARSVMLVVEIAVAGLWTYSAVRWVGRGDAVYAIPSVLLVVACVVWITTFGRRRPLVPSSWDPEHTVVRVSALHEARMALMVGLVPVALSLSALDRNRSEPSVVGLAISSAFGLMVVLGTVAWSHMLSAELVLTADEVVITVPRGVLGIVARRRARAKVTGYRRRLGSVELLPWPLAGGTRGRAAREQRLVVPSQLLARVDVERALLLHGIALV
jgi:hypothetical protein